MEKKLLIEGMSCNHCVNHLKTALTEDIKGIKFKVTDKELLEEAGGIIQGMSGSPIIQNGNLVGAVSHVVVNDPICGFGVFAEWMYYKTL